MWDADFLAYTKFCLHQQFIRFTMLVQCTDFGGMNLEAQQTYHYYYCSYSSHGDPCRCSSLA